MPLFCWFHHFLDSRAEIVKFFRWYFGRNDDTKRTFWNWLTFTIFGLMISNLERKWKPKPLYFGTFCGLNLNSFSKTWGSLHFKDPWIWKLEFQNKIMKNFIDHENLCILVSNFFKKVPNSESGLVKNL